ncbi:MAG TPA: two-component regulator propeller domain-containing protein [Ohtaekwangia sp.]|nr:two-component regulator propeller domain-containing protein [Ohtaekwangia sp.]
MDPRKIWFLLLLCFFSYNIVAQKNVVYQQLSIDDGLSQNTINTIFQDSRGFMWFATQNGLNKYDGATFTVFQHNADDTTTISSNDVYAAFEDRDLNLWFGTRSGLSRFNRDTNTFSNFDYQQGGQYTMRPVWCILGSKSEDELWIGASGGLFSFHTRTGSFNHYKVNDSIQNANSIRAICEDQKGKLWIAPTVGPLMQFDRNTKSFLPIRVKGNATHALENITCLALDHTGDVWIGNEHGVLIRYDNTLQTIEQFHLNEQYPIRTLMEDQENNLWLGTDKGGTFLFDKKRKEFIPLLDKNEESDKVVLSLYNDLKGDVWLGTYHGGVYLFDKTDTTFQNFSPYQKINGSNESNSVLSIMEGEGSLWLGTDGGGLVQKKGKEIRHYKKAGDPNSLPDNTILCQAYDHVKGLMYIGTYANGMSVRDMKTGKVTTYTRDNGLNDNSVWAILLDNDVVWIGTNNGGLNMFDTRRKTFRQFTNTLKDERTISSNTIRCILKDSRNNLWIGAVSGLNRMNEDSTFTSFFHHDGENSISDNNILCLYEDAGKNIWMGTLGGGLNKYDHRTNTFTSFQQKDGLAGTIVYGVLEDDLGHIWMSTNKGISRLDPLKKEIRNFDTHSGLPSSQFNIGAAFKSKSGKMFFGNVAGVCSFFPHHIQQNLYRPPIVITDFSIFNKSVSITQDSPLQKSITETSEIKLDHTQNVFSFKFAALNFTHSEMNSFAYKLEPFDKDWNYVGQKNEATYTNLDPGTYQFKVKGSNNDGIWNENYASVQIIITPPFWKTFWFQLTAMLIIVSGIYGTYLLKIRSIKRQKSMLTSLVNERTLEIEEKNKLLLETQIKNAQLANQKLKDEITSKSKELTNYTLLIIQKNKLLGDLKTKLKEVIRHPATSNLRDFKNLVKLINQNFSPEKEWNEFNVNFNRVHEGFIENLKEKFPDLTLNDLRLCTLYRIGIPTKDIAEAMGISQSSVKMARYRLRKKLSLAPDEDILIFLNTL